jgi:hypothetical protein
MVPREAQPGLTRRLGAHYSPRGFSAPFPFGFGSVCVECAFRAKGRSGAVERAWPGRDCRRFAFAHANASPHPAGGRVPRFACRLLAGTSRNHSRAAPVVDEVSRPARALDAAVPQLLLLERAQVLVFRARERLRSDVRASAVALRGIVQGEEGDDDRVTRHVRGAGDVDRLRVPRRIADLGIEDAPRAVAR